jgi:hypothetical protein
MDDGWILIRASNTSPKIRLTVEAASSDRFEKMHREFTEVLQDAVDEQEERAAERQREQEQAPEPDEADDVEREDWMSDE